MEEFLQDKIFQFYYQKIYGKKSNYLSFKTFADKDKVSFLINLYLFISDINNNKRKNIYGQNNEKDNFFLDNYNKIMGEYTNILNKYNKKFHSKDIIDENKLNINNIFLKDNNNIESTNKEENKIIKNDLSYKEAILNNKSDISPDTNNNVDNNKKQEENKLINNNNKNDLNSNINNSQKPNLNKIKIIKQNFQNNIEEDNDNRAENEKNKTENINYKNNLENSSKSYDLQNINKSFNQISNINNNNFHIGFNLNNKNNLIKSGNFTSRISPENQNLKLMMKDIALTEKTLTEKSIAQLEEFTNDNIVEKLIKCPQNKNISLNCSEANKIALVLINLMESKNDLETEIEEERKKNEIILEKLKLDFEQEKNDIKSLFNKKENNIKNVLSDLENEINIEKTSLNEEEIGSNLWDHITIENQRTKEIRESIMKKLESFKK